jgi:uroporphyrinogen-III synthase
MTGFNGLRVLSFESRRAKEIALLITNNGGVPMVAPSTREVPEGPNDAEQQLIRDVLAQQFDSLIFMTGVGARAFITAAESICTRQEFLKALAKTKIVVRGPKPSAVMREFNVPVTLAVPEPNTWREIVQALDANLDTLPLRNRRIAVQEHGEPSPELYSALRERGAEVFPVHVYRAVCACGSGRRRTRSSFAVSLGPKECHCCLHRPNYLRDAAQSRLQS